MSKFSNVNMIVAVGSVDGVCTTAAILRLIGRKDVGVCFTQAFTVDKIDPTTWDAGRQVAFVDLAVNNRDKSMTADFVSRVNEAGHKIVAVIDEHSREDWLEGLGTFDGLIVEPETQNSSDYHAPKSSGAVLSTWLYDNTWGSHDMHTSALLEAADAGDRMDFSTHFGGIVNRAVKSDIGNDSRRVHLARHLAFNTEADEQILGWIEEYEQILANHDAIVADKYDLGSGIHRVTTTGVKVDMSTLMFRLYGEGARVVALEGEAFVPAEKAKRVLLSLGTNDKELDLMALVREAGITPLGGFANKVNIELEDEKVAIRAIGAALLVA